MPIVVDEVIVSIEVSNAASGGSSAPSGAAPVEQDKQALISECVERVLEILERREER
jgi:hypothetical protein